MRASRGLRVRTVSQRRILSRRHPLALSGYAIVATMGVLFITGWLDTGAADRTLFAHVNAIIVILWKWELLLGGGLALAALAMRPRMAPRWPDLADLLRIEGIGALVGGLGVITYVVALSDLLGWKQTGPGALLYGLLAAGLLFRGVEALIESTRIERLARLGDAIETILNRDDDECD